MDAGALGRIQDRIVRAVAGNVGDVMDGEWGDREWIHLFVDIEVEQQGGRSSSITFALARHPGQPLERVAFRLPPEAKQLFDELAEAMREPGQDRWSTARLRIEQDGGYAFEFLHDAYWRLAGNLMDKRFADYGDRWLETPAGRDFAAAETRPARPGLAERLRAAFPPGAGPRGNG